MQRDLITKINGFKVVDGNGVRPLRLLAINTLKDFDPFLLFDCYDTTDPMEYQGGFPGRPFRGLECITYVKNGSMRHRDMAGNDTTINAGDVEWVSAASGTVQTYAFVPAEHLQAVQLWLNIPDSEKMDPPDYHIIRKEDIEEFDVDGTPIRLLAGSYGSHSGYQGKHLPLDFYEADIKAGKTAEFDTPADRSVAVFVFSGNIKINGSAAEEKSIVKLSQGDSILIEAESDADVLIMSSVETGERVVWGNTIIMTNERDIEESYRELEKGTFIKK